MTCRYIKPDQIPEEEHWKGKSNIDPAELYTGDVDLTANDADFSFLENDDTGMNGASLPENIIVGDSLGGDFIMIDSPSATTPLDQGSAMEMPAPGSLSDTENNPPTELTITASPARSPNSDGESGNAAVLNAPVWF